MPVLHGKDLALAISCDEKGRTRVITQGLGADELRNVLTGAKSFEGREAPMHLVILVELCRWRLETDTTKISEHVDTVGGWELNILAATTGLQRDSPEGIETKLRHYINRLSDISTSLNIIQSANEYILRLLKRIEREFKRIEPGFENLSCNKAIMERNSLYKITATEQKYVIECLQKKSEQLLHLVIHIQICTMYTC
jgi:hypothetical protein